MAADTITQIDEALHKIRARLAALEGRGGASGGAGSTMRLSDSAPLPNGGSGSPGDDQAAARGDHVHPAVTWSEILGKPASFGQDLAYRHVQSIATDTWVINHGLNKYPGVSVVDTAGDE